MSTAFVNVPLFQGIGEDGLKGLGEVFEHHEAERDEVLFDAGDKAHHLYLLVSGGVAVREDGKTHIELEPPSLIGELGAMTKLTRRVTAVCLEPSAFLRATGEDLMAFFARNSAVAVRFYQNLLAMAADKIRRDEQRVREMRGNIIATQHELKRLRNLVLESPDTAVSQPVHDIVDGLIAQNRRANYIVEPPIVMPAEVRLPGGKVHAVSRISRQFVVLPAAAGEAGDDDWRGVLVTGEGDEIPIAGAVSRHDATHVRIELDHLIDEYADTLEHYLTQAQLLDIFL